MKKIFAIIIVAAVSSSALFGCSSSKQESSYAQSKIAESKVEATTKEVLKNLQWPGSGLAKMLPKPVAQYGEVKSNDNESFIVVIQHASEEDFNSYIESCKKNGFSEDITESENSFTAKNSDDYSLTVSINNYGYMSIKLLVAKYKVDIEVDCEENLIFSKYDIDVFIDDSRKGTVEHGASKSFSVDLLKGSHEFLFKSAEDSDTTGKITAEISEDCTLKYELYCTSSGINVTDKSEKASSQNETTVSETKSQESSDAESKNSNSEDTILTIENNTDFASLMEIEDQTDSTTIKAFVDSHKGAVIKFDGCIAFMMPHGKYKTRFDVCMAGGDYAAEKVYGPLFSFEDVNYSNMKVSGADTVAQGMNFTITAKIKDFSDDGNTIDLEPVELKAR